MGTADPKPIFRESARLLELTLQSCETARAAAAGAAQSLVRLTPAVLDQVRQCEEELDALDREINEGMTAAITQCGSEPEARELLACLKYALELERVGDVMLGFVNRAQTVQGKLDAQDLKDLAAMAAILEKMLADDYMALRSRDLKFALNVLRHDAEMDRLRNLIFLRHIGNTEGESRTESFHVVFMSQGLERAGDHAKNLAEQAVHLVSGRTVRHLLRENDKPDEVRFLEWMRAQQARRSP